jgi:hypothetical protein
MPNASFRCKVFLVLLLTVLAVPWVSAAGGPAADRPVDTAASRLDLFDRLWTFLESAWSETGCMIDPDGRCAPAPQPQTDEGCMIDPNGRCRA